MIILGVLLMIGSTLIWSTLMFTAGLILFVAGVALAKADGKGDI